MRGARRGRPDYEAAIAAVPASAEPLELEALTAPVFYTSGTTGRPKGVVHGVVDAAVAARIMEGQVALWGWTADDVYILSGPAYHAGPGGYDGCAVRRRADRRAARPVGLVRRRGVAPARRRGTG